MKPLRYICLAVAAFVVVNLSACIGNDSHTVKDTPTTPSVTETQPIQDDQAKDVDYMTKLGLMKGHLLVAKELLDQNQPKQAEPHIGHPVEEIYGDLEGQLQQRNVKEFKSTLNGLHELVKNKPQDPKINTSFTSAMTAVDNAIAVIPEAQRNQPEFVLGVINGLLDTAKEEYEAAIANDKIVENIEYQDSRGFVIYAQNLYKNIASKVKTTHPEAEKAITSSMSELLTAWPSAIPPSAPVKTPAEVNKLVLKIQENFPKVAKS